VVAHVPRQNPLPPYGSVIFRNKYWERCWGGSRACRAIGDGGDVRCYVSVNGACLCIGLDRGKSISSVVFPDGKCVVKSVL
jgi:hypothetical protein